MVQLILSPHSRVKKGRHYAWEDVRALVHTAHGRQEGHKDVRRSTQEERYLKTFFVYRWNPETQDNPRMDSYELDTRMYGPMVLDVLMRIKDDIDPTLVFRRSCREGVCGSCAMNINGVNTLACTKSLHSIKGDVHITPLPHTKVMRDLIPDLTHFYAQYASIKPWLHTHSPPPEKEWKQSPQDRKHLDGLYECVLCACCSTACPSYWWHEERFLGPASILQTFRWVSDSRDEATGERLSTLDDPFRIYRCYLVLNCAQACPKQLNPAKAIAELRKIMLDREV